MNRYGSPLTEFLKYGLEMFFGFEFFLSEPDSPSLLLLLVAGLLGFEFIGLLGLHVVMVDELLFVVLGDEFHSS